MKWHIKQNSNQYFIKETQWDREIQKELRVFTRRMETVRVDQQPGYTVSDTRPNKEYQCFREEHFMKVTHSKEGWQFRVPRQQKTTSHMWNNCPRVSVGTMPVWETNTGPSPSSTGRKGEKTNGLGSRLDLGLTSQQWDVVSVQKMREHLPSSAQLSSV